MKKKRFCSALLALTLALSLLPAASATQADTGEMAQVLAALSIMVGNEEGDLMLTRAVTRAEFTKMLVSASPMGDNVGETTTVSPYPDVPYTHWSASYVEAAVSAGYVQGNLYGYFEPDRTITLKEGVTMAVRLLGYSDADFSGAWPAGQMALYRNLDLDEGISIGPDGAMTRQDAMYLFYNLLTAPTKTGQTYLTPLGHALTATGEIDRVSLVNSVMSGPVVMAGDWQSKMNLDPAAANIYRNGTLTNLAALQPNDVLYWSKSMRTIWAYSNKVTGVYQAVTPSASSPSAVTVAGNTYTIETSDAKYALSNLGPYQTGDTVTLLLGRDGGVAAVASSAQVSGTLYGVVSGTADSSYTDQNGNRYTAKTVSLTATDGSSYAYPVSTSASWKAGDLVQVTLSDGEAKVSRLSASSLSGKVNAAGTKLGNNALADDVEILDMNGKGEACKVSPSRLAGVNLSSSAVKYARKNAAGEIDRLILNDVTGDLYTYGVLTEVNEATIPDGGLGTMMGIYQYDISGTPYVYQYQGGHFNAAEGPACIKGNPRSPSSIRNLTSVSLSSLDALSATTKNNQTFPLSASVAVYEVRNGSYYLSSLERVRTGYTLTGYYDKTAEGGGRIRVILAREQ